MCQEFSNWGRWGPDDELGTLNLISPEHVKRAAGLVRKGNVISLAVPYETPGPQGPGSTRINPIHLMTRDGNDVVAGTASRDFHGGSLRQAYGADDLIIMSLQSGTQWDAFSHIFHEGRMYNGYDASWVTSMGAIRNDIAKLRSRLVGRGVLLDVARYKGAPWLTAGAITADDLDGCARYQNAEVQAGDILLVRTGRVGQAIAEGNWAGFTDREKPQAGLGLEAVEWLYNNGVAAVASDNMAVEVRPSQVPDFTTPLHVVLLVYMGLPLGEIFDLETLADDCGADGVYDFLFVGPPLPFTHAVGSPLNPLAIR
jgi:kynurenine formamidase